MGVGRIEVHERDGRPRASAVVGGHEVWFESSGHALRASPEAFASALLVAALRARAPLRVEAPLSRAWRTGAERLIRIFGRWWGYRRIAVESPIRDDGLGAADPRTALCFSGGADSFHTLLRSAEKIDLLVSVHGFDVPLGDARRWAAVERSLREVSEAVGVPAVVVRTNLREHPLVAPTNWEHAHGGALAAVGHLLSGAVGRLLVSSSVSRSWRMPWGSHWKTDPLWSSPELSVVHWGASMSRAEKIREICREPLVERHLRVCWENRAPTGNCSRCVKCMRTALVLLDEGVLDRYPGFARAPDLAANLDAMPTAPGRWKLFDALLEKGTLPPDVHRALGDLRRRTRRTRRGFLPWLDWFRERGTP